MKKTIRENVTVSNNIITIYKLENQFCVSDFIRSMEKALRYVKKHKLPKIVVECNCSKQHIFPDACVPISALINQYRKAYKIDVELKTNKNTYLQQCHFEKPLDLTSNQLMQTKKPFDKIFVFANSKEGNKQIAALNQSYVDYISRTVECEEGVLAAMMWCIYEIMDNILVHSHSDQGYIMAQFHKKTHRLAICIFDCGIGILNSLKEGDYSPSSEIEAIELATQEGVSDGQGQGNGLYGLKQIVSDNGGRLVISSGSSTVEYRNNPRAWSNNPIFSKKIQSTTIDFQLHLSKKIDLKDALKTIGGIDDFDPRIDGMIQEDTDYIEYKVKEQALGTITRLTGKELRTDVLNIIKRTRQPVIIDFSGIMIASSSFIDEFIAKMFHSLGDEKFHQSIVLVKMNENISHLCNRAISMRMEDE